MTSKDCADLNRILRVWYLPNEKIKEIDGIYEWWRLWIKKPLETQFGKWGQDNLLSNFWGEIKEREYIFLTHKPLTFGHSQAVFPKKNNKSEESCFFEAAKHIKQAINTFNTAFNSKEPEKSQKIQELVGYKSLSLSTHTYGNYIKTLVLRSSASEIKEEYTVHLAPYFQSHEIECKKLFQKNHSCAPHKTGGLLGWLGERETEVDQWEFKDSWNGLCLDQVAIDVFKLPLLAHHLRQITATSVSGS